MYGSENVNCVPVQDAPRQMTVRETIQDAKGILAELNVMITDTIMVLFGTSPDEKTGNLDGKCLEDDVRILNDQARKALSMMAEMRRRLV